MITGRTLHHCIGSSQWSVASQGPGRVVWRPINAILSADDIGHIESIQLPSRQGLTGLPSTAHKILIADTSIAPEGVALLEGEASLLMLPPYATEAEIIELARDVDAILLRACIVSAPVIRAAPALKVVSRHGVGVDNVDVAECTRHGIAVAITEEANSQAVSEHAFACMLALANDLTRANAQVRQGKWERHKWVGVELHNKVLGVVGLGRIGSRTARQGRAFDMQVLACDPYVAAAQADAIGANLVDLETLLDRADFVSIHVPLNAETRHLFGPKEFAAMKPGSILVNTARGGIIDELALHEALVSGHLFAAALDVFETEPMAENHPLLDLENVLLSPHVAGQSTESMVRMSVGAAENIRRVLRGERPSYLVNPEVLRDRSRVNWRNGSR